MSDSWLRRALAPVAELREGEARTALLMFAYSFLAMTAYNILKPITRSKFITELGADNLPYVQLAAGVLIGVLMQGYSRARRRAAAPLGDPGHAGGDGGRCSCASGCCSGPAASGCRSPSTCSA